MTQQPKGWLLLAVAAVALMVMAGEADATAVWVMTGAGGLLASLPGRIRHRKAPRQKSTWQGCLLCFCAGLLMVLALGLAQQEGCLTLGLMQGSASAWAFGCLAWLTALITARWRRKHP